MYFVHISSLLQLLIYTSFPTNKICLLVLREYFLNHWLILLWSCCPLQYYQPTIMQLWISFAQPRQLPFLPTPSYVIVEVRRSCDDPLGLSYWLHPCVLWLHLCFILLVCYCCFHLLRACVCFSLCINVTTSIIPWRVVVIYTALVEAMRQLLLHLPL